MSRDVPRSTRVLLVLWSILGQAALLPACTFAGLAAITVQQWLDPEGNVETLALGFAGLFLVIALVCFALALRARRLTLALLRRGVASVARVTERRWIPARIPVHVHRAETEAGEELTFVSFFAVQEGASVDLVRLPGEGQAMLRRSLPVRWDGQGPVPPAPALKLLASLTIPGVMLVALMLIMAGAV